MKLSRKYLKRERLEDEIKRIIKRPKEIFNKWIKKKHKSLRK